MKVAKFYLSSDGKQFDDADKCRDHEDEIALGHLVSLDAAAISEAINGGNPNVREGIRVAFNMIQADRKERGEVKTRKPKVGA